ncbi:MAG: hypothetical protein AB7O59_13170 [Pirellulales bacterium]
MGESDWHELRERSDALGSRLAAFRAHMKPIPPSAPKPLGPTLWSRQWFAELLLLPLKLIGLFILGILGLMIIMLGWLPLGSPRKSDREPAADYPGSGDSASAQVQEPASSSDKLINDRAAQRSWLETCIVFLIWGTDGLKQGKQVPQFSLAALFGITTMFAVWFGLSDFNTGLSKTAKGVVSVVLVLTSLGLSFTSDRRQPRTNWLIVAATGLVVLLGVLTILLLA